MAYDIVTDSSANLTEDLYDEFGITVLPLRFMLDGKEYVSYKKGEQVDLKLFYKMMREGSVFTTSLPSPEKSEIALREILDAGRDILYIGFSSGLSGTYDGTRIIMEQLAQEYPERKLMHIDTLAAAAGQGLLVWYAAQMRAEGATMEEVYQWVEDNRLKLAHWFTVDELVYLFRGGRLSRTSAWAGTLLKIKPVLHVDNEGKLVAIQKVRGRKKSIDAMFKEMCDSADAPVEDQVVFISHGDCIEDVEYLEGLIRDKWNPKKIFHNILDPVIGAHSGPGTLALFFLADHR